MDGPHHCDHLVDNDNDDDDDDDDKNGGSNKHLGGGGHPSVSGGRQPRRRGVPRLPVLGRGGRHDGRSRVQGGPGQHEHGPQAALVRQPERRRLSRAERVPGVEGIVVRNQPAVFAHSIHWEEGAAHPRALLGDARGRRRDGPAAPRRSRRSVRPHLQPKVLSEDPGPVSAAPQQLDRIRRMRRAPLERRRPGAPVRLLWPGVQAVDGEGGEHDG